MIFKNKKKFIFTFFLSIFFIFLFQIIFAQGDWLEVDYPEVLGQKLDTAKVSLPEYFKYIFNFSFLISGIILLGSLVFSGYKYLTSAGDPKKLKEAKNRIINNFIGIILLLGVYIFLNIINPQLVILEIPSLSNINAPASNNTSNLTVPTADLLKRIKNLATEIKNYPLPPQKSIDDLSEELKKLLEKCDCNLTLPQCVCLDYQLGDNAQVVDVPEVSSSPVVSSSPAPSSTNTPSDNGGGTVISGNCPCPGKNYGTEDPSKPKCVDLTENNIPIKTGHSGKYADASILYPLKRFDSCIKEKGRSWRVTEACEWHVNHKSLCHKDGTCVDIGLNGGVDESCSEAGQKIIDECAKNAGFAYCLNECPNPITSFCKKSGGGTGFHVSASEKK